MTPANFVDWRAQTTSFEALGALPNWTGEPWPFNVVAGDGVERVPGIYASSGFFKVMGVGPLVGRVLDDERDRTRGRRTVVISYAYWRRASAAIRQRSADRSRSTPFAAAVHRCRCDAAGFRLPSRDEHLALACRLGRRADAAPGGIRALLPWYTVFGRLKHGVTIERARAS